MDFWVQFDEEPFSLKAQFANLGPVEGVYFGVALKNLKAHVSNSQIDLGALSVSRWVEADAIHFQFTDNLQDLEIGFSRSLAKVPAVELHDSLLHFVLVRQQFVCSQELPVCSIIIVPDLGLNKVGGQEGSSIFCTDQPSLHQISLHLQRE